MTQQRRPGRPMKKEKPGVCANTTHEAEQQSAEALSKQERALRKALSAYLNLHDLRRLATSGENVLAALKRSEEVPQDIQALLSLLQAVFRPGPDERIQQAADIAALLMVEMSQLDHEEFWEICLDAKNHVQRIHHLYKGSVDSSVVRIGELFRLPLLLNSAYLIVAHNHPSGDPTPSAEDIETTRLMVQAGELLQVEVLDHLILGQGRWLSMREKRLGW